MKNKKTMIISGIASVLTATIIYVSGGQVLVAAILGGASFIPGAIYLKSTEKNIIQIEEETILNNSSEILVNTYETDLDKQQVDMIINDKTENNNKVAIAPIKRYDDVEIPELITIDAFTQKENNLVRIRKKETEEKLRQHNELKKQQK